MMLVGLEGKLHRKVTLRTGYTFDSTDEYESVLTVTPYNGLIVEEPELGLCSKSGRTVPSSCLSKCEITGAEALSHLLVRSDVSGRDIKWLPLFQACCLNFDKTLVSWFGSRVSLQSDLSIALQFGKLEMEQAAQVSAYDIPPNITALDALLKKDMKEDELEDLEYRFRVIYTFDSASKGTAHIQFLSPDSAEGKSVQNVLQKFKIADELYQYKPSDVAKIVRKASGKQFSVNDQTRAWQEHKVRPPSGAKSPEKTNRDYCIYHPAHRDYTYNDKWIELLVAKLSDSDDGIAELGPVKIIDG